MHCSLKHPSAYDDIRNTSVTFYQEPFFLRFLNYLYNYFEILYRKKHNVTGSSD